MSVLPLCYVGVTHRQENLTVSTLIRRYYQSELTAETGKHCPVRVI